MLKNDWQVQIAERYLDLVVIFNITAMILFLDYRATCTFWDQRNVAMYRLNEISIMGVISEPLIAFSCFYIFVIAAVRQKKVTPSVHPKLLEESEKLNSHSPRQHKNDKIIA